MPSLPRDVCTAGIEDLVEIVLPICIDTNVQHDAVIGDLSIARKMELHRHVVLVVRSIEAREVDGALARTRTKVLSVDCGPAIVQECHGAIRASVLDGPLIVSCQR